MVVRDLNVECVTVDESEADAPLVIDGDCVLPSSISPELVESIPWWAPKVMQVSRQIDVFELPPRPTCDLRRESPRSAGHEQLLRLTICKRLDHDLDRNASRDTCQPPRPRRIPGDISESARFAEGEQTVLSDGLPLAPPDWMENRW